VNAIRFIDQVLKPILFLLSLLPLALLIGQFLTDTLGTNPVETLTSTTGEWTLHFLIITLCITPLRKISGWHGLIKLRRMFGLFSFFYAFLHVLIYTVFEHSLDLFAIIEDIIERPFILLGFVSFLMLIPLALTSTNKMVKRLGGRTWQQLHRLIYPLTIGGALHFLWLAQSKVDVRSPLVYLIIISVLLILRYPPIIQKLTKR